MISIVCVYNDEKKLNALLLKSLKNQTSHYQLILVDNTNNEFKSAAAALNSGAEKANGNYIMFVHQDVDLLSDRYLEEIEPMLKTLPNLGVAGVAGKSSRNKSVMTNICQGIPPRPGGELKISEPTKVQTLDECLVLIPRSVFNEIKFDNLVCDNWHLYAVDYCLTVKKIGLESYVIPSNIYHESMGTLSIDYYLSLSKVLKKHRSNYSFICTTMNDWNTTLPLKIQVWKPFKYLIKIRPRWL